MRTYADTEIQARLLKEIKELYEKRGKLEEDIKAVDAMSKLRNEKAALHDIELYRRLHSRAQ
ncbi:MAG: hypothetical protein GEU77_20065 [Deltaproteobacteria bacterium]|nr:hypothetical protein [Deltaproteobacteria bacterium]